MEARIDSINFSTTDCILELHRNGRVIINSKKSGDLPPFSEMEMPSRDFWEMLSGLLRNMNDEIEALRHQHTNDVGKVIILEDQINKGRKIRFIGTNKKEAFFAGVKLGKMQAEGK